MRSSIKNSLICVCVLGGLVSVFSSSKIRQSVKGFFVSSRTPASAYQSAANVCPKQQVDFTKQTFQQGIWISNVNSSVYHSRQNISDFVLRMKNLNFNVLFPVALNKDIPFFKVRDPDVLSVLDSPVYLQESEKAWYQGRDILQEIIDENNATPGQKLKIIPWFEYGVKTLVGSKLFVTHPEWFSQNNEGFLYESRWSVKFAYLNPMHPEARNYILKLISDVVRNYDIDGIQIDDHFSLNVNLGYDNFTRELYKKETGRDVPSNIADPMWMRWRADKLTDLVGELSRTIKQIKPGIKLVMSPNPADYSYKNFLQDWMEWPRRGYVDELIMQMYRPTLNDFHNGLVYSGANEDLLPGVSAKKCLPFGVGVISAASGKNLDVDTLRAQIRDAKAQGMDGVYFFQSDDAMLGMLDDILRP